MAGTTGEVRSRRRMGWVESTVAGRATGGEIEQMVADYRRLGQGTTWVIDASETTSYSPDAVQTAIERFGELARAHGLTRIVALITRPTVRMGASVVSMSLRAVGSSLVIDVVESREEMSRALESPTR